MTSFTYHEIFLWEQTIVWNPKVDFPHFKPLYTEQDKTSGERVGKQWISILPQCWCLILFCERKLFIISSRPYYLCLFNAIVFVGVHCCFVHNQNSHQRSRLGHRNRERYRFCWPGTILTPAQRYLQLRSSQIHDYNDITTHFTSVMWHISEWKKGYSTRIIKYSNNHI